MKSNLTRLDRTVRNLLAALIGLAYVVGLLHGIPALALGLAAIYLLATGLSGHCPAYAAFGVKGYEVR